MRIDARYPIVFGAFYAPGTMMLFGAFALGYSIGEVRGPVAFLGGLSGAIASTVAIIFLFAEGSPILVNIGRRK